MTRPSKRELERDVEELRKETTAGDQGPPTFEILFVDPVTDRLYDERGAEPAPVRELPDADEVLLHRRVFTVALDDVEEYDTDVVDVDHESARQPVAILRSELADSVDEESALTVDELPDDLLPDEDLVDFNSVGPG